MKWTMLLLAGIFEITWAYTMKLSDGFTKLIPSVITVIGYLLSAVFLALALKKLSLGTAYAMWTGMGIVGTTVLGVVMFKENISIPQVLCIGMIIVGIVGLKIMGE